MVVWLCFSFYSSPTHHTYTHTHPDTSCVCSCVSVNKIYIFCINILSAFNVLYCHFFPSFSGIWTRCFIDTHNRINLYRQSSHRYSPAYVNMVLLASVWMNSLSSFFIRSLFLSRFSSSLICVDTVTKKRRRKKTRETMIKRKLWMNWWKWSATDTHTHIHKHPNLHKKRCGFGCAWGVTCSMFIMTKVIGKLRPTRSHPKSKPIASEITFHGNPKPE